MYKQDLALNNLQQVIWNPINQPITDIEHSLFRNRAKHNYINSSLLLSLYMCVCVCVCSPFCDWYQFVSDITQSVSDAVSHPPVAKEVLHLLDQRVHGYVYFWRQKL